MTVLAGWIFAPEVAGFFVRSEDGAAAADPVTLQALRFLPLGALAIVPFFMFRPLFEAAHQPRTGILISTFRYLCLSVPLVLLSPQLASWLGISNLSGVIIAVVFAGAVASALAPWLGLRLIRPAA